VSTANIKTVRELRMHYEQRSYPQTTHPFLSRFVQKVSAANGQAIFETYITVFMDYIPGHLVCKHAVCPASLYHKIAGGKGQGPALVLIPGWPQTAEASSGIFELLSKRYRFLALDLPGLGDSSAPASYDTATVSKVMAEAIHDLVGDSPYHLIGHDVGAWIAYPWAAQFGPKIKSLSILDASVPGFLPHLQFPNVAADQHEAMAKRH
jgi:pimeloyl-ACP methyl ester carboxylesterase